MQLIAAKVNLDLDDGYGATALYEAIYNSYDEMALLLIEAGAKVNTKTGIYIDGTGDITPLHRATDSPRVVGVPVPRPSCLFPAPAQALNDQRAAIDSDVGDLGRNFARRFSIEARAAKSPRSPASPSTAGGSALCSFAVPTFLGGSAGL